MVWMAEPSKRKVLMKNAFKTVGFMLVMVLLSKVLGQVREIMIAAIYGGSVQSAAFYAASALPLNLFDIVFASAVTSSFIPVYNTYLEKNGENEADRFASAFINVVLLCSVLLSAVLMIFASPFISALYDLSGEAKELAVSLTVIMMPVMIFASLAFSFVGILQSKGEFNIPAVMSLVLNLAMVTYLWFFNDKFGVYGLSFTLLIGWLLQFLLQLPVAIKKGFKYKFIFKHEGIKSVLLLALPIMVGTWLQPITAIINTSLASSLDNNIKAISSLNYANKLYFIVPSVFTMSITNFIFPKLSRQITTEDDAGYKNILKLAFKIIFLCLIPITAVLVSLRTPIIEIVYKRGEFGDEDLYLTAGIFMYYSLGILFFGITDLLNKAFYAQKKALSPAITAGTAIVINIILSYALKAKMGVFGLALSSSLTALYIAVVLFWLLNRKTKFLKLNEIFDYLKILIFGVVLFFITNTLFGYIDFKISSTMINTILRLVVAAGSGGIVYLALVYFFIDEVKGIVKKVFNRSGE